MKYLKMLGLAAIAATAFMALAGVGSASAAQTTLCKTNVSPCPAEWDYAAGTVISADLASGTKAVLKAGFANVECEESSAEVKTTETSGEPLKGDLINLSFAKCGACTVKVLKPTTAGGTQAPGTIAAEGNGNGNVTIESGVEVEITGCGATCFYGGKVTGLTLDGSSTAPKLTAPKETVKIEKLPGSSFLCASPAEWTATYSVTSPIPLFATA